MHDTLFALPVIKQLSAYISQRQLGELPLIIISHPKVRGAVSIQGAQLIDWQPHGQNRVSGSAVKVHSKQAPLFAVVFLFVGLGLVLLAALAMVLHGFYRGSLLHIMNTKMV